MIKKIFTYFLIAILLILIAILLWFSYDMNKGAKEQDLRRESILYDTYTPESMRLRLNALVETPDDGEPYMLTVKDETGLSEVPILADTRSGDVILIYPSDDKGYIYRLATNKVIKEASTGELMEGWKHYKTNLAATKQMQAYHNDRYVFDVFYPTGWTVRDAPSNDDGRTFSDGNGNEFIVAGSHVIDGYIEKQSEKYRQKSMQAYRIENADGVIGGLFRWDQDGKKKAHYMVTDYYEAYGYNIYFSVSPSLLQQNPDFYKKIIGSFSFAEGKVD